MPVGSFTKDSMQPVALSNLCALVSSVSCPISIICTSTVGSSGQPRHRYHICPLCLVSAYCIISLGCVSSHIRTVMMEREFVSELSVYSSEITLLLAWEYIIKCHRNIAGKYAVDYFMV